MDRMNYENIIVAANNLFFECKKNLVSLLNEYFKYRLVKQQQRCSGFIP